MDGVTASTVLLTWTNATDDFGPIRYEVLVDGTVSPNVFDTFPVGIPGGPTSSMWVRRLDPGSTSTLTVRTVDDGGNVSAPSDAVTVTTDARSDSGAPTTPTLTRNDVGGTGACPEELWIRWTGSTDDLDPPAAIEYEVRINGVIYEVIPGGTQTVSPTPMCSARTPSPSSPSTWPGTRPRRATR